MDFLRLKYFIPQIGFCQDRKCPKIQLIKHILIEPVSTQVKWTKNKYIPHHHQHKKVQSWAFPFVLFWSYVSLACVITVICGVLCRIPLTYVLYPTKILQTAHTVRIQIQVGLQTYMFRYKEAFLDINQFIRDLFVILSSLNASHNNVPRSLNSSRPLPGA